MSTIFFIAILWLESNLKCFLFSLEPQIFSWEPIECHDAVNIGWSTLDDLSIHDGKLLACSHYQNCVDVWVADISVHRLSPYHHLSMPLICWGMMSVMFICNIFVFNFLWLGFIFSYLCQLIEPHRVGGPPQTNVNMEEKFSPRENQSLKKLGSNVNSSAEMHTSPCEYEATEIRNIYVDSKSSVLQFVLNYSAI